MIISEEELFQVQLVKEVEKKKAKKLIKSGYEFTKFPGLSRLRIAYDQLKILKITAVR